MSRVLLIALALAAVAVGPAAASPPGPPVKITPPPGSLVQLGGPTGCISTQGGACAQSPLLKGAWDVKVSPDGLNVYVASRYSNAVAVYARDPHTGGLTPLPGQSACVSRDGSGGFCAQGRNLYQPVSLAFGGGGGQFLLVASRLSNGVAVFRRDLSPGALHGQLTQPAGKAGCINSSGAEGCASPAYTLLDRARAVVAAGSFIYVAVPSGPFVDVLTQVQSTGELEQLPLPYGCLATNGGAFGVCTKTPPMPSPVALAVSGSKLLIGSAWHYNAGDFDQTDDVDVSTLVELPLDSPNSIRLGTSSRCFAASASAAVNLIPRVPPGCIPVGAALFTPFSVTASPRGDVVAVGAAGEFSFESASLFGRLADGTLGYDTCVGGSLSWSACDSHGPATVVTFSPDEQRLYTPAGVYCRNPTDPLRAGYVFCAPTRAGRPTKSNGDTNVIPTAMTTSPDGSTVYLTFGTPSGFPTKLGGIYVLHPAG